MKCRHCGEEIRCDLSYRTETGLAYFHIRRERDADHRAEPEEEN